MVRQSLHETPSPEVRTSTNSESSEPRAATQCTPMESKSCPPLTTWDVYRSVSPPVLPASTPVGTDAGRVSWPIERAGSG